MRGTAEKLAGGLFVLAIILAGCGSDGGNVAGDNTTSTQTTSNESTQNACPVDGCVITIDSVEPEGDELTVVWSANFAPDFSKNHIHIYWDTYTAGQVSSDATARGLEQGIWVPTDSYPSYTTSEVVSTSAREGSMTLCVTASDGDHNVINDDLVDCVDVSSHL